MCESFKYRQLYQYCSLVEEYCYWGVIVSGYLGWGEYFILSKTVFLSRQVLQGGNLLFDIDVEAFRKPFDLQIAYKLNQMSLSFVLIAGRSYWIWSFETLSECCYWEKASWDMLTDNQSCLKMASDGSPLCHLKTTPSGF